MLEYALEENVLTAAPGDFRAQVVNLRSHTQEDIIDRVMKIGAGLTRSDIAAVLEAEKQVIADIIAEGEAVNTELFNAFPSIQGVFTAAEESLDPARHTVRINVNPGIVLRHAARDIKTRKAAAPPAGTLITSVTDIRTGSVNGTLTPGRDIKISGHKLKIAGDDPSVGLFFVPLSGGGAAVAVDPQDIVVNNPSELLAVIPALSAGDWQVRVVTQYAAGKHLKTPRSATFEKPLTVA
jgi:hypothetical protein